MKSDMSYTKSFSKVVVIFAEVLTRHNSNSYFLNHSHGSSCLIAPYTQASKEVQETNDPRVALPYFTEKQCVFLEQERALCLSYSVI